MFKSLDINTLFIIITFPNVYKIDCVNLKSENELILDLRYSPL